MGQSKPCRKIIEMFEEDLAASGACAVTEVWFVYVAPPPSLGTLVRQVAV